MFATSFAALVDTPIDAAIHAPLHAPASGEPPSIEPTVAKPHPAWQAVYTYLTRPKFIPMTDAESLHLYVAQRTDVDFEGGQLAVWHWDTQGPRVGPRVLLVHGWESRATHWHAWVPALLDAGFQVSALDLPAHGHSSGEHTDVVQWGRAVLAVAQTLGPLHAVVGHSMGSAASLYAFAHGLRVQGSVHLSGPSSLSRVLQYAAHAHGLDGQGMATLLEAFTQRIGQPLSSMDVSSLAVGLKHPGWVFHDPADSEMPFSESTKLVAQWPQAQLIEAEKLGHRRILRDADVIEQSVQALRALPIASPA